MKGRFTAIVSIAGVLAAGSAAAVVNTRVLDSSPSAAPNPAESSIPSASTTASELASPTTTSIVAVATPSPTQVPPDQVQPGHAQPTAPPPTQTQPTASATVQTQPVQTQPVQTQPAGTQLAAAPTAPDGASQATYTAGPAGTITLNTAGGLLTIARIDPAPGWSVKESESESPTQIEVRLRSESGDVRFEASLVFGVVTTSLEEDLD